MFRVPWFQALQLGAVRVHVRRARPALGTVSRYLFESLTPGLRPIFDPLLYGVA